MQTKALTNIRKDKANVSLEWSLYIMSHIVEDVNGLALFVSFSLFLSHRLLWLVPRPIQCFRSAGPLPQETSGIANLLPKPMIKHTQSRGAERPAVISSFPRRVPSSYPVGLFSQFESVMRTAQNSWLQSPRREREQFCHMERLVAWFPLRYPGFYINCQAKLGIRTQSGERSLSGSWRLSCVSDNRAAEIPLNGDCVVSGRGLVPWSDFTWD